MYSNEVKRSNGLRRGEIHARKKKIISIDKSHSKNKLKEDE